MIPRRAASASRRRRASAVSSILTVTLSSVRESCDPREYLRPLVIDHGRGSAGRGNFLALMRLSLGGYRRGTHLLGEPGCRSARGPRPRTSRRKEFRWARTIRPTRRLPRSWMTVVSPRRPAMRACRPPSCPTKLPAPAGRSPAVVAGGDRTTSQFDHSDQSAPATGRWRVGLDESPVHRSPAQRRRIDLE